MNVLIADDHPLVLDGLRIVIEQLDPGGTVHECDSFIEANQKAETEPDLDLAILDLRMPGMDGARSLTEFVEKHANTPVLIMSGIYASNDVAAVMKHGAMGFLPKSLSKSGMVSAIRLVLAGEKFVPADIFLERQRADSDHNSDSGVSGKLAELTKRELQVLRELVQGQRNKEIANNLDVQEVTIKLHLKNVYKKLGATNRAHVVRIAIDLGLLKTTVTSLI